MLTRLLTFVIGSTVALSFFQTGAIAQPASGPTVGYPLEFKISPPVSSLPRQAGGRPIREIPENHPPARLRPGRVTDPVVQSTPTPAASLTQQGWEGLGTGYPGYSITAVPPDPNMAVGPNHIVQWVNNAFVVFNKQGGQVLAPVADSDFWGALSTCYQGGGFSDPVVQYDRAADRWLIGEVALPLIPGLFGQYAQCFAVSNTSDPTGTYKMWAYGFGMDINDYPKIGIWPDGYYVTFNMFLNGATFGGARVCSFNRSAMLSGVANPARVCFQLSNAYDSLLPSDLDGSTPPPAGSPNLLMNINTATGALNLWKFHVDYAVPNNSTFTGPISIAGVAPFNGACIDTRDCVPQPGTTQKLDALGDRLMYRLPYRNFGDHEALVATHTVTPTGANTAIRWYEIRNPNTTPSLFQQGSFSPDTDYRFMGSIAMDHVGNIGVGYTVGSGVTFPSLRYTGRQTTDPLGAMQAETVLAVGGGSQTGYDRWGDYASMRIDTDDCTFWYTGEYQASTQTAGWNTRIGSFKFPSCSQSSTPVATNTALAASPNPSIYSQPVTFTATVTPTSGSGIPTGSVTFKDGTSTLGSSPLNSAGVATLASSTLAQGAHSITAVYSGDLNFSASTSSVVTQNVNPAGSNTTLSAAPNPSTFGQSVTFTATVTPSTATGTVQFKEGANVLGSANLSAGKATLSISSLTVGSHSIAASYLGSANFGASTSAPLSQVVNKANTTTTVTSSPDPSSLGQTVTFTATISNTAATGTVTFFEGSQSLGSGAVSNGRATLAIATLSVGRHSITATYGGDANFNGSTSAVFTQNVKRK